MVTLGAGAVLRVGAGVVGRTLGRHGKHADLQGRDRGLVLAVLVRVNADVQLSVLSAIGHH